jgi:hypothetical protein
VIQLCVPLATLATLLAVTHKVLKLITASSFIKTLESDDFRLISNLKDRHHGDAIGFETAIEATVTSGIPIFKAVIL